MCPHTQRHTHVHMQMLAVTWWTWNAKVADCQWGEGGSGISIDTLHSDVYRQVRGTRAGCFKAEEEIHHLLMRRCFCP